MSATRRARKPASSVEMLLLRDRFGYRRYRKTAKRDPEKRQLLLALALKRIEKAERGNYKLIGPRKRKVTFPPR